MIILSKEEIVNNIVWKKELICISHPVSVENNCDGFVTILQNPNDGRSDDLGAWKCTGARVLQFSVKVTNKV